MFNLSETELTASSIDLLPLSSSVKSSGQTPQLKGVFTGILDQAKFNASESDALVSDVSDQKILEFQELPEAFAESQQTQITAPMFLQQSSDDSAQIVEAVNVSLTAGKVDLKPSEEVFPPLNQSEFPNSETRHEHNVQIDAVKTAAETSTVSILETESAENNIRQQAVVSTEVRLQATSSDVSSGRTGISILSEINKPYNHDQLELNTISETERRFTNEAIPKPQPLQAALTSENPRAVPVYHSSKLTRQPVLLSTAHTANATEKPVESSPVPESSINTSQHGIHLLNSRLHALNTIYKTGHDQSKQRHVDLSLRSVPAEKTSTQTRVKSTAYLNLSTSNTQTDSTQVASEYLAERNSVSLARPAPSVDDARQSLIQQPTVSTEPQIESNRVNYRYPVQNGQEFIPSLVSDKNPSSFQAAVPMSTAAGSDRMIDPVLTQIQSSVGTASTTSMQSLPISQISLKSPGWDQSLGSNVAFMLREDIQSANIRIKPAELGSLNIQVSVQSDQLNVTILASNAQTRESLEASMVRLREQFSSLGFSQVDVNVGDSGSTPRQTQHMAAKDDSGQNNGYSEHSGLYDAEEPEGMEQQQVWTSRHNGVLDTFA